MSSVNKVILLGNLGNDPEQRVLGNGDAVTGFSLATSETWKDKNSGEKKEATEWHRVVCFRRLAEIAGQYLAKGSTVYIEGAIKSRKWTDKEGVERVTVEIIASDLKMVGKPPATRPAQPERPAQPQRQAAPAGNRRPAQNVSDLDDDIPW